MVWARVMTTPREGEAGIRVDLRGRLVERREVLVADGAGWWGRAGEQVVRGRGGGAGAGEQLRGVADAVDGEQRAVGQELVHPDGVAVGGVRVVAGGQQQNRSAGVGGPRAGVALGGAAEPWGAIQPAVGPHRSG